MSAGHQTKSALIRAVSVPASQTLAPAAMFGVSNEGRLNLRVDCYLGKVAGTPSLVLQDTNGHSIFSTIKTNVLAASTDITVTPDYTTGTFTAASHGLANGTLVALNSSGAIPGNLDSFVRYFVLNATTNTFQLGLVGTGSALPVSFSSNGSGTITVTAATVSTFSLNVQVAGDQAVLPLRPNARIAVTTAAGQTVQLLDVRYGNCY